MLVDLRSLKNLNANRARVAFLEKQIPQLQNLAAKMLNDVSIATAHYGDDAGNIHVTGSHSDPTSVLALRDMPEDIRQLNEDIRALIVERYRKAAWIAEAEAALNFLTEKERKIVTLRLVEHRSWEDVVDVYFEETGRLYSERSCRNTFNAALAKIEPFFPPAPASDDVKPKRMVVRAASE